MCFEAILFDLDGTLLDTLEDLGNAANRVLEKYDFPTHTMADYRYFVGDGVVTLMNRALPEDKRNNDTIQICVKTFREEYGKSWNVKTRPYNGVAEMLDALTAGGLKKGGVFNKTDRI